VNVRRRLLLKLNANKSLIDEVEMLRCTEDRFRLCAISFGQLLTAGWPAHTTIHGIYRAIFLVFY